MCFPCLNDSAQRLGKELLKAVGARKAARAALTAVAAAETARAKRRRVADRADGGHADDGNVRGRAMHQTQAASTRPSSGIPALQDPYGGLNRSNSIDLTEAEWDVDLEDLPAEVLDAHEEATDGIAYEVGEVPRDSGDVDDQELAALLGAALEDESVGCANTVALMLQKADELFATKFAEEIGDFDARVYHELGDINHSPEILKGQDLLNCDPPGHSYRPNHRELTDSV
eukprot:s35_g28.t1